MVCFVFFRGEKPGENKFLGIVRDILRDFTLKYKAMVLGKNCGYLSVGLNSPKF